MLGDVLPALPDRIKQQLFDAFDLAMLYHKKDNQVTCWAIITPSTPAALAAIIADSETPTSPAKIILRICHANLDRSIHHDHGRACATRSASIESWCSRSAGTRRASARTVALIIAAGPAM